MERKRKDVNGYVEGKLIAKNLLTKALKENRMLDEVLAELRSHFPGIVFKVE